MHSQYSGRAPIAWEVHITCDGVTWMKVAEIMDVIWSEEQLESKMLNFETQRNVVGVWVKTNTANKIWGHYTVYGADNNKVPFDR